MAIVKPFRAVRPAKDKVAFVASRSYESYSRKELNATLTFNPFSFLHIINPGFKYARRVKGEERFKLVHNRYQEFLEEQVFEKDEDASFYVYKVQRGKYSCCGIFCATSVADYRNNIIKKHEDTIARREKLFANYLQTVKFNAEPVLAIYPDNVETKKILDDIQTAEPDYFFSTADKVTHSLWRVSKKSLLSKIESAFKAIESLYIADGHHRSASSNLLATLLEAENKGHTGLEPYNFFMSYLIPESEIWIYEFNRKIKDLNGLSKEEFLVQLDTHFRIENKGKDLYKPSKKHHFSMYLDGSFYSLYLRKKVYSFTDALSELDTQILYKTVLQPILGINDLRNDKRIGYGFGKHNVLQMKEEIDQGKYAVGFGMIPVTVEELKAIADAGLVMPPKSTYIEPKLRSGLTIYEF